MEFPKEVRIPTLLIFMFLAWFIGWQYHKQWTEISGVLDITIIQPYGQTLMWIFISIMGLVTFGIIGRIIFKSWKEKQLQKLEKGEKKQ